MFRTLARFGRGEKPLRIVGQIEYYISPYEQKLFSDLVDAKFMMAKAQRKIVDNVPYFAPGLVAFFGVYTWGNWYHDKLAKEHWY